MDQTLMTATLIVSHALFFLFGLAVANHYNDKAEADKKYALEQQWLRLRANADADDPCKPYKSRYIMPAPIVTPAKSGFDDNPLPGEFEQRLKTEGQATALLNKRPNKG